VRYVNVVFLQQN